MNSPITDEGVEYFYDWEHDNEPDNIRALALKLAIERGGQTCPVCEYDFVYAREIVTGEVKEIDRLRRKLASSKAELLAAREALSAEDAARHLTEVAQALWDRVEARRDKSNEAVTPAEQDDAAMAYGFDKAAESIRAMIAARALADFVPPTPPTVNSGDGT